MHACPISFFLLVLFLFTSVNVAIYTDEAYQIDYHHSLLGIPQAHTTFFHRPSANSKATLLYTLSERNILGAVNPKDGAVLWRQRLADQIRNETSATLLEAGEGANTIISAVNGVVRAWDAVDGRLAWAWQSTGQVKGIAILGGTEGEKDVVVLSEEYASNTVVRLLVADTGDIKWEFKDGSGDLPFAVLSSNNRLFYISLHSALMKGYKIKITELSPRTGNEISEPTLLNSENELTSEACLLYVGADSGVPYFVWTDKALKSVKYSLMGKKHVDILSYSSQHPETTERIIIKAPRTAIAAPHFLIHYQGAETHWAEVYWVDHEKNYAPRAYDLPRRGGKGAISASSQGKDVYFIRTTGIEVTLVSSSGPAVLKRWEVSRQSCSGVTNPQAVLHAVSEVVARASTYSVRSALVLPSGDWELIRNGDTLWMRPEGLAGIVAAEYVEISKEEDLAQDLVVEAHSSLLKAFMHRIRRHIRDLQYFPHWAESIPKRLMGSFTGDSTNSDDQGLNRDSFGFHKIIIVAAESGRLAALDAGNQGRVIWNVEAIKMLGGKKWDVIGIDAEDSTTLVRGNGGEFLRVSSNNGTILQYQPGAMISGLQSSATVYDRLGKKVQVPVNGDGFLGDVPEADIGAGTIVVTQGEDSTIKGWALAGSAKPTVAWQFMPTRGEKIHTVVPRPTHDPVASIGKALGDRNVLYKYLNPNILLITAVDSEGRKATFYVVDSISGAVLHSTTHSNVDITQPISSTISENWLAYSLFSDSTASTQDPSRISQQKLRGYQLVVSELYESDLPNDRGPLGPSSNSSSIYPTVNDEDETTDKPYVVSQTFLIPGPISHMSSTSTMQGITPRALLCIVPHLDSLIAVPRHILDPRRPVGRDPTAAEAEEGLFRYSPLLEFEPKWTLNHKRDLPSIANVISSPSLLESTTLIFAFGDVDMFGTRMSPIGGFDILGKGFSKLQLVGTVVALAIGTVLVEPLVRKKQIDGSWKA